MARAEREWINDRRRRFCLKVLLSTSLKTMSDLQDQFDKGEITPQEFFDAWDLEMEERERLHPGFQAFTTSCMILGCPSIPAPPSMQMRN
jgi:hypothetical protein